MSTYGVVLVGRNDDYGGNLGERATYALNSCIETYDEVIYVDWNSRGETLVDSIEKDLIHKGKLRCITVTNDEHRKFTDHFPKAQPCSEVLGRNVGLRRLNTDFLCSTNIDEINPLRRFLEEITDKRTMIVVARRGITLNEVKGIGSAQDINGVREVLLTRVYPQSYAVTREPYSLVEWCGDLEIAHKDIWYSICGFEESQLGVGVHDSFVQRKAVEHGFNIMPCYSIPLWHLDHHKSSPYNETSVGTSTACLYDPYVNVINENWGFPEYDFKERVI